MAESRELRELARLSMMERKARPTRANYRENGPGHAAPVGLYRAGAMPEGVQNIAGNVWEWVQDSLVLARFWCR